MMINLTKNCSLCMGIGKSYEQVSLGVEYATRRMLDGYTAVHNKKVNRVLFAVIVFVGYYEIRISMHKAYAVGEK